LTQCLGCPPIKLRRQHQLGRNGTDGLGGRRPALRWCKRWRIWSAQQVGRYEWEIDLGNVKGPAIHGLRGTGCWQGGPRDSTSIQIANDIGMSRQTVEYYMRFKDQMGVAAEGRSRLELVSKRG